MTSPYPRWMSAPYTPEEAVLWAELCTLPVAMVPSIPMAGMLPNDCHANALKYCRAVDNTPTPAEIIFGWAFGLDTDGTPLAAFAHSVVQRDGVVWCLTPRTNTFDISGKPYIAFREDLRLTWHVERQRGVVMLDGCVVPQCVRSPEMAEVLGAAIKPLKPTSVLASNR